MEIFSQPQSAQNSTPKPDFPYTKPLPGHWYNKKNELHFSQKKKSQRNHLFNPVHPHVQRQDKRRRSNSGTESQMTSLQRMQMLLRQNMTLEERLHRAQSK